MKIRCVNITIAGIHMLCWMTIAGLHISWNWEDLTWLTAQHSRQVCSHTYVQLEQVKNQLRDCETDNVTHQVDGRKQALQSRQTIISTPLEAEDEAAGEEPLDRLTTNDSPPPTARYTAIHSDRQAIPQRNTKAERKSKAIIRRK